MADKSWYEWFFGKKYLQARQPTLQQADIDQEIHFLTQQLHLEPGRSVLDLCCGHGRHAVPLAQQGLEVVGVDISEYLINLAEQAASNARVNVDFVLRDMREIDWKERFDGVINMFTAFGFFSEDHENFRVLELVAQALKPGGYLCMDVISYVWLVRNWESSGWTRGGDDVLSLEERSMNWCKGLHISGRTIIEPEGKQWNMNHSLRVFPPHELVQWIERAGMEVQNLFGNFGGAPFDFNCRRLILVARKP